MTIYVGGLRARLIKDNLVNMIEESLDALGWFDSGRQHQDVTVIGEALDADEQALPNIVAISIEDQTTLDLELGSNLQEITWPYVIDVYGESESLALHLAGDIRDIVGGKIASIGRDAPYLYVYDLTQATVSGTPIFGCDIEDVVMSKTRFYEKPYQKHWWMIFFDVIDAYMNDEE